MVALISTLPLSKQTVKNDQSVCWEGLCTFWMVLEVEIFLAGSENRCSCAGQGP